MHIVLVYVNLNLNKGVSMRINNCKLRNIYPVKYCKQF